MDGDCNDPSGQNLTSVLYKKEQRGCPQSLRERERE